MFSPFSNLEFSEHKNSSADDKSSGFPTLLRAHLFSNISKKELSSCENSNYYWDLTTSFLGIFIIICFIFIILSCFCKYIFLLWIETKNGGDFSQAKWSLLMYFIHVTNQLM